MAEDRYQEVEQKSLQVGRASIEAGLKEQQNKLYGSSLKGAAPDLSKDIKIPGTVETEVNKDGINVKPIALELELPKPKPGEITAEDNKKPVNGKVNNAKLAQMLTASGYADKGADLTALDQVRRMNTGLPNGRGQMVKDPRIDARMNALHRQSAQIFGLHDAPKPGGKPGLEAINTMSPQAIGALVKKAQENNPDLKGGKTVEQVNAQKLKEREAGKKDGVKIQFGVTGLNFKNDRIKNIDHELTKVNPNIGLVPTTKPQGGPRPAGGGPKADARPDGGPAPSGLQVITHSITETYAPQNTNELRKNPNAQQALTGQQGPQPGGKKVQKPAYAKIDDAPTPFRTS